MRTGIERTYEKAVESPFLHGIPYIWCSNNLTTAMLTQCRLYRETTGDETYAEMEAALRDWLFGCNPWGNKHDCGTAALRRLPFATPLLPAQCRRRQPRQADWWTAPYTAAYSRGCEA